MKRPVLDPMNGPRTGLNVSRNHKRFDESLVRHGNELTGRYRFHIQQRAHSVNQGFDFERLL